MRVKLDRKEYMEAIERVRIMIKAIGKRNDVSIKAHSHLLSVSNFLFKLKHAKIDNN